jgi:hypothetical protein
LKENVMVKSFERETATQAQDLPHAFEGAGRGMPCDVCALGSDDPRHLAWEQQQVREKAAEAVDFRELGS